MYKVDVIGKKLIKLESIKLSDLDISERYDVQKWVGRSPDILGEELLIIQEEFILPSGIRLDLLAIDKNANLVIIELKRDDSGSNIDWQAIKYASYCSVFLPEDIYTYYAEYLKTGVDDAKIKIEKFIDDELVNLNQNQRIILISKDFHPDVLSAVFWLRDYEIEIKCIRLRPYVDVDGDLFIAPDIIIPIPEAKDYIKRKEIKHKARKKPFSSTSYFDKGNFGHEELEERLKETLSRQTVLTPRFIVLLEILLSENRVFKRDEIKQKLFEKDIGLNLGQSGRYLSNLSAFLTKKSNSHLRQMIEFEGDWVGQTKDNYRILPEFQQLILKMISEKKENTF